MPVEVLSAGYSGGPIANTFSVATTSQDGIKTDNSASGPVLITTSSISGTLFRDFGDDGAFGMDDNRVVGLTLMLTGEAFDERTITPRTMHTAQSGNCLFPDVPRGGNYTVKREIIAEAILADRDNRSGNAGGTTGGPLWVTGIGLGPNSGIDGTGCDFRIVPLASVGIAKALTVGPTVAADCSFITTFQFLMRNLSREPLNKIAMTNPLAGIVDTPPFRFRCARDTGGPGHGPVRGRYLRGLRADDGQLRQLFHRRCR